MNDVGLLIYNRRKELGLTLEEVGNAVGVGKSTVKKWENGDIANMRRDRIEKLSKVLKISPVRLLGIPEKIETAPASTGESDQLKSLFDSPKTRSEWLDILSGLTRENKLKLIEYARLLLLSQAQADQEAPE